MSRFLAALRNDTGFWVLFFIMIFFALSFVLCHSDEGGILFEVVESLVLREESFLFSIVEVGE